MTRSRSISGKEIGKDKILLAEVLEQGGDRNIGLKIAECFIIDARKLLVGGNLAKTALSRPGTIWAITYYLQRGLYSGTSAGRS